MELTQELLNELLVKMCSKHIGSLFNGNRRADQQEVHNRFIFALYENGEYLKSVSPQEALKFLMEGAKSCIYISF